MPRGGTHEPEQIRPDIVDDIAWVLVRRAGDLGAAARVLRDIEALQAIIARLVSGEVPDDTRELDNPPRGTDVNPNI
jgi:hypothetical protein